MHYRTLPESRSSMRRQPFAAATVQTVLGPIPIDALGRTLMHEHLQVAAPGWEFDHLEAGPSWRDRIARCVDKLHELKDAGYASLVDPCPIDLGRDVELLREVSGRTGFHIICAAGFYHGEIGASAYWKARMAFDPDLERHVADLLAKELTEGIGSTGVRPGILKTATGKVVTSYERMMMSATAIASIATGIPVTTHTEGIHGDMQLDTLCGAGLDARRIIVGHSCGSNDLVYHQALLDRGAYLGFDRFGFASANTDEARAASLVKLVRAGYGRRIVVSHDCVLLSRGLERFRSLPEHGMLRFQRRIVPMLREHGLEEREIDDLTLANPMQFFNGG